MIDIKTAIERKHKLLQQILTCHSPDVLRDCWLQESTETDKENLVTYPRQ